MAMDVKLLVEDPQPPLGLRQAKLQFELEYDEDKMITYDPITFALVRSLVTKLSSYGRVYINNGLFVTKSISGTVLATHESVQLLDELTTLMGWKCGILEQFSKLNLNLDEPEPTQQLVAGAGLAVDIPEGW